MAACPPWEESPDAPLRPRRSRRQPIPVRSAAERSARDVWRKLWERRSQASSGSRKTLAARVAQRQALAFSRKHCMSGHTPRCRDCPAPSRLNLAAVVIDVPVLQVHARRGPCAAILILATRPTERFLPNRYDLMKSNTETFCLVWLPCTRAKAIEADRPLRPLMGVSAIFQNAVWMSA